MSDCSATEYKFHNPNPSVLTPNAPAAADLNVMPTVKQTADVGKQIAVVASSVKSVRRDIANFWKGIFGLNRVNMF